MGNWVDAAAYDDVSADAPLGLSVDGHALALFRLGDEVFALQDQCPHGSARLSDGFIEDGVVECPLHQGRICIRTGAPKSPFIRNAAVCYAVRIVNGRVEIEL